MLFVSMMVIAGFSLMLALAVRIPTVSTSLRDFFGGSGRSSDPTNDRSGHMFMLLVCYSSPLLMMIWVSLLRRFILFQQRRLDRKLQQQQREDSEFNMES
jgi:phosphotransferase system  glucose/maltose/N-acetylglucosamine-specific IIC component